jgi:site-specific recombinase XerD
VQRLMRHADVRTTVLYTHLVDAELAAKVRRRRA